MSPTILIIGSYRFFFYSGDRNEPPHVHVERDKNTAKIWLTPIRLQSNKGFRPAEIQDILRIIENHQEKLLEHWHEYFSD